MTISIASTAAPGSEAPVASSGPINERRVAELFTQLLSALGEDPSREGLRNTPRRVAAMWQSLLSQDAPAATCFPESTVNGQLVIVSGMSVWSFCEHHMLPMNLVVTAGYLADGTVVGLSKFGRIAQHLAGRLQVQERFTRQMVTHLAGAVGHDNVAVTVQGVHQCMSMRGVRMEQARTTTVRKLGRFASDAALAHEYLTLTTTAQQGALR
ncbi:GTP cyclohydrolase I FolE [Streptomyces griseus]|uniref:GTP cyclohydrolase I n=1 Tax=Streptomyces griseus TaxID=1911 RepID=UPI0004C86F6C|nr:GTP cyclohydrolase I FolE [Streptomyces griseus]